MVLADFHPQDWHSRLKVPIPYSLSLIAGLPPTPSPSASALFGDHLQFLL